MVRQARNALIPTRDWSKVVDVAVGKTRSGQKAATVRLRREDRTWTVTDPEEIRDLIGALTMAIELMEEET